MLTISVILLLTCKLTTFIDACHTPDGKDGECVPINQCPEIFSLFQGKMSGSTDTFLRQAQSQCGFIDGTYPKVCCPLKVATRLLPQRPHCGAVVERKIWGGKNTDLDEFPWTALLEYQYKNAVRSFGCGGSLINTRYVLTARHCLKENLVQVRLGEWNITANPDCLKSKYGGDDCAPEFISVGIEKQIPYQDKTSLQNDIALLRLDQDVKYTAFIKPICLPTTTDLHTRSYVGEKLTVTGWGLTENEKPSNIKLKVSVPIKPLSECSLVLKQVLQTDVPLHEGQLCAGGEKGKDSCNGDSGGPLMYKTNEWYAVGIVSFGPSNPCGQENKPAVYIKVSNYINWIVDNMKP